MSPFIRFGCPACQARIKAPPKLLEQHRACPNCGRDVIVRPEAPEDAGPTLVLREDRAPPPRPLWARRVRLGA
jgi:hypothetical protein